MKRKPGRPPSAITAERFKKAFAYYVENTPRYRDFVKWAEEEFQFSAYGCQHLWLRVRDRAAKGLDKELENVVSSKMIELSELKQHLITSIEDDATDHRTRSSMLKQLQAVIMDEAKLLGALKGKGEDQAVIKNYTFGTDAPKENE